MGQTFLWLCQALLSDHQEQTRRGCSTIHSKIVYEPVKKKEFL
ncbi:MAG: hypothetical protein V1890_06465 [Candidatus Zixiibacteriota bacterium]